jgi:hypothetical protein
MAANALLARVYLYLQDWSGAAAHATKVIDQPRLCWKVIWTMSSFGTARKPSCNFSQNWTAKMLKIQNLRVGR